MIRSIYQNIYQYIFIAIIIVILSSCRKDIPQLENPTEKKIENYSDVFESFWNAMNNNYVFWDIDPTNWDDVYIKYKPLFQQLDINNKIDQQKAYTYFQEMTAGLIDSHYTLDFINDDLNFQTINPAEARKSNLVDHHDWMDDNHFFSTIPLKYLDAGFTRDLDEIVKGFNIIAVAGKIKSDVLYFRFNTFRLTEVVEGKYPNCKKVLDYYLDEIKNTSPKGIIIDLRSNNGGNIKDLNILVGSLTGSSYVFGSTHSKLGLNRLSYTPWIDAKVNPYEGAKNYTGKIVVLTDVRSISMAEISSMALKRNPTAQVTIVGERTFGATGPIVNNLDYFSGGSFNTKYLKSNTSAIALRYIDGKSYEGVGFPPDIEVKYNQASFDAGIDLQLEKAISLLVK